MRATFVGLISDQTIAALVVSFDPAAQNGWRADVRVAEWLSRDTFAAVLRQAADRYDPPTVVDFRAEHAPDCDCARCVVERRADERPGAPV